MENTEATTSKFDLFIASWTPRVLSILRIIAGFLFTAHGSQKLLNFPHSEQGTVELFSFFGFAGALELVGGILIMLGLFTRITAFILSGMMAVAYFIAHAPGGFFPIANGGELAVIYCFVFLYFAFAGGGPISIDSLIKKPVE